MADYKSRPPGAGFGSLQAGPPPATVLLNLVLLPSHQNDTALRVHFRFSQGQAERSTTCPEEICPPVTSRFLAEARAPGSRRREKPVGGL